MKPKNKIEFIVPDKYFKNPMEDLIIGVLRYLREQGKICEFLGFAMYPSKFLGLTTWHSSYVVLIDGVKYNGSISGDIETNYHATFYVVNDEEHDYIENRLKKRVNQILDVLEDRK